MGCALEFGLRPHGLFIKNIIILEVDGAESHVQIPNSRTRECWRIIIHSVLKKNASLNVQTIPFPGRNILP